jgi:hypothetical protein
MLARGDCGASAKSPRETTRCGLCEWFWEGLKVVCRSAPTPSGGTNIPPAIIQQVASSDAGLYLNCAQ